MTDLEDLWNALPTGEPPVSRILHQGRRGSAAWRAVRRPLLRVGGVAALGGAFVAGTLTGPLQLPGGGAGPGRPALSPVSFQADLAPAASCEELLASYVDRALGQVSAWGWDSGSGPYGRGDFIVNGQGPWGNTSLGPMLNEFIELSTSFRASRRMPMVQGVTSSNTGTNVQEAQVDEPDSVKTNGDIVVRLRGDELLTYDVTGTEVRELSALRLSGVEDGEILLAGKHVVVIGADRQSARSEQTGRRRGTRVQTVSLGDPGHPEVTDDVTYSAATMSARQHGASIRLVLSTGLPDLDFAHPGKGVTQEQALIRNRALVKASKLSDWLPAYSAGGDTKDLLECGNVAVPSASVGLDTAAVVTFKATSPGKVHAFGLAGATSIAYESADHLYLASSPATRWGCFRCRRIAGNGQGTSYLFQFELSDDRAVHVASGEVEGTIRDRWSLDEAGGVLRAAIGPSSETGDFNSVVTFTRRGDRLVESGRLDRLGKGEEIKSVRWQDDLALVVTFREVDPLYVIDLRGKPALLSELKVPGFSSYLHPVTRTRLVGVGQGPGPRGWGAQMGLFAVEDLKKVQRLDVWNYRAGSTAVAGFEPRAFTWLPELRTVLTVIQRGPTGWLSIQRLGGNRLHNRMVEVEYGDDIVQVRTLGLPGGRVILVTGEDVRFLEL